VPHLGVSTFIAHAGPPLYGNDAVRPAARPGRAPLVGATPEEIGKIQRRHVVATTVKKQLQALARVPAPAPAAAAAPALALAPALVLAPAPVAVTDEDRASFALVEAMLWSDPDPAGVGVRPCSSRGAGLMFGLDAAHRWMMDNNVFCFIRSHQCVPMGYEKYAMPGGDDRRALYTVFSSADYRGAGECRIISCAFATPQTSLT